MLVFTFLHKHVLLGLARSRHTYRRKEDECSTDRDSTNSFPCVPPLKPRRGKRMPSSSIGTNSIHVTKKR